MRVKGASSILLKSHFPFLIDFLGFLCVGLHWPTRREKSQMFVALVAYLPLKCRKFQENTLRHILSRRFVGFSLIKWELLNPDVPILDEALYMWLEGLFDKVKSLTFFSINPCDQLGKNQGTCEKNNLAGISVHNISLSKSPP